MIKCNRHSLQDFRPLNPLENLSATNQRTGESDKIFFKKYFDVVATGEDVVKPSATRFQHNICTDFATCAKLSISTSLDFGRVVNNLTRAFYSNSFLDINPCVTFILFFIHFNGLDFLVKHLVIKDIHTILGYIVSLIFLNPLSSGLVKQYNQKLCVYL